MILDGLGPEIVDLIKDCMGRSMVPGRVATSMKYGQEFADLTKG